MCAYVYSSSYILNDILVQSRKRSLFIRQNYVYRMENYANLSVC